MRDPKCGHRTRSTGRSAERPAKNEYHCALNMPVTVLPMGGDENFQGRSVREGRIVQQMAEAAIAGAGFAITDRNKIFGDTGATVNFACTDRHQAAWHFDVAGSMTSDRAGLLRTDSVWKALGRASVVSAAGCERLILLTTNLPKKGSVGDRAMKAGALTYFDAIELLSAEGKQRLREYADGGRHLPLPGFRTADALYPGLTRRRTALGDLVAVPTSEIEDVLPERRPGFEIETMPYRVKVFIPTKDNNGSTIPKRFWQPAADQIVRLLCDYGGGCTGAEAAGAWVDPIGGTMHEQIFTAEAFGSSPYTEALVRALVDVIVRDLKQHTAAMVLNDQMVLLTPTDMRAASETAQPPLPLF